MFNFTGGLDPLVIAAVGIAGVVDFTLAEILSLGLVSVARALELLIGVFFADCDDRLIRDYKAAIETKEKKRKIKLK